MVRNSPESIGMSMSFTVTLPDAELTGGQPQPGDGGIAAHWHLPGPMLVGRRMQDRRWENKNASADGGVEPSVRRKGCAVHTKFVLISTAA